MKRFVLFTLIMILGTTTVSSKSFKAQQEASSDTLDVTDFKPHSLQFQVNGLEDITDFQGGIISYKYHLNNKNAIRFGIDLYGASSDTEEEIDEIERDTTFFVRGRLEEFTSMDTLDASRNRSDEHFNIGIKTQYIRYFNPEEEVKVFGGIGPILHYSEQERQITLKTRVKILDKEVDTTGTSRSREILREVNREEVISSNSLEVGVSAVLGVEWFVHDNISFTAEYGLSALYRYTESEMRAETSMTENESESNRREKTNNVEMTQSEEESWLVDDNGAKIGITIYFN